jgi:hypothetical protein
MLPFPEPPADAPRATGTIAIRFEDVAEDGRLVLEALSPALGEVGWRKLLGPHGAVKAFHDAGVHPILTRLVAEGEGGPFSTQGPLEATGTYRFAHTRAADGAVDRVVLDMWIEGTLPIGRTYGPPPERAGERVRAGRLYAEHVLTRLFAPPDQRKVTSFSAMGEERAWSPVEAIVTLPPGAVALDEMRLDPTPIAFGLAHTDSNRHVNSLVYPRLFEDAALRRFLELGKLRPPVLARRSEAAFRKPCFAGERYAIALQAFTLGAQLGAVGFFLAHPGGAAVSPEPLEKARPHCFVRMLFD